MTSSTLYREGDDLDTLLAELSAEFAGRVRVVKVDEGRDGGVLGFFARRRVAVHFELDADDAARGPARTAVPARANGSARAAVPARAAGAVAVDADPLAELIDRADAVERRVARPRPAPRTAGAQAAAAVTAPAPRAAEPAARPAGRDTERATRADFASNAEFASMLLELAARKAATHGSEPDAGSGPAPVLPEPATRRTLGTTAPDASAATSRDASAVTSPSDASAVTSPVVSPAPLPDFGRPALPAPSVDEPSLHAPVAVAPWSAPAAAPADDVAAEDAAGDHAEGAAAVQPAYGTAARFGTAEPFGAAAARSDAAPSGTAAHSTGRPEAAGSQARVEPAGDTALVLRRKLTELGVPIHLIPPAADDVSGAVNGVVRRLDAPPQPPATRGSILVIVGPAHAALESARTLAGSLGLVPGSVWTVGAGPRPDRRVDEVCFADAWDAADAATAHRAARGPLVIAVVPTDGSRERRSNQDPARILRALAPDVVWAVVDASCKPADARARLARLAGVDALVVIGAADTASPATVLELGFPVALLDGAPATAARWRAALHDSLAALEA